MHILTAIQKKILKKNKKKKKEKTGSSKKIHPALTVHIISTIINKYERPPPPESSA